MNDRLITSGNRHGLDISYSGAISLPTFEERLKYLSLWNYGYYSPRDIGKYFYDSKEWRQTREEIIARDLGYDLGCAGVYIPDKVIVHHIKPVIEEDLDTRNYDVLFNPDNLITVSHQTHNYIHYRRNEFMDYVERYPGDTKLW